MHYTGYTNNLLRRFKEHSLGRGARFFRGKTDLFVLCYEMFNDQKSAMQRELEIKRNKRIKQELIQKENGSEKNGKSI